jgi:L-asparaginase II
VVRSGFVEGHHAGTAVVLDAAGAVVESAGDPGRPVFPRSANKPMQAAGMIEAGLRLAAPDLALAAASHSGEARHVERVRAMLADGGLGPDDLGCPPDLPLDQTAARAVLAAGGGPTRLTMNCSGKHAAMLRTCRAAGWPVIGYLDPAHPLQQAIRATVEKLAGVPSSAVGVDGCGAPLFALPLTAVAQAFLRLVEAAPGSSAHTVAAAMRAHPELVGGTGRDVTRLMEAVPGLLAKDGAEGLYAAALPGRGAVAVKIEDGAARARVMVVVSGLRRLGVTGPALDRLARYPLWGGGQIVGAVHALW